jgi:hypothetical protein
MNNLKRTLFSLVLLAGFALTANAQSCPTVYPIQATPSTYGIYGTCEYTTSLFSCTFVVQPGQTYTITLTDPSVGSLNVVNDYTIGNLRRVWFEGNWDANYITWPLKTFGITFTVDNGSCATSAQYVYRVYDSTWRGC